MGGGEWVEFFAPPEPFSARAMPPKKPVGKRGVEGVEEPERPRKRKPAEEDRLFPQSPQKEAEDAAKQPGGDVALPTKV